MYLPAPRRRSSTATSRPRRPASSAGASALARTAAPPSAPATTALSCSISVPAAYAPTGRRENRDPDLDDRAAVLRDGVRDQRVADDVRVLARRRRPRPQSLAAARSKPHPNVVGAVR